MPPSLLVVLDPLSNDGGPTQSVEGAEKGSNWGKSNLSLLAVNERSEGFYQQTFSP